MYASKAKKISEVNVNYEVIPPRFSVQDAEELQQGVEYLTEYGYAVFSNILTDDEVNNSVDLLWKHLENLKRPCYVRRNNPEAWDINWPGSTNIGLLNDHGIGQSEFMWYLRGIPNIKKVFSHIWNSNELFTSFDGAGCFRNWHLNKKWKTDSGWYHCDQNPFKKPDRIKKVFSHIWNSNELFTSFDGAGCFRNWHLNKKWKTDSGWYHCDQNPFKKPDRCSVQGFVSLTDNNESTGGLVIVPGSHKNFINLQFLVNEERLWGDFVAMPSEVTETIHPRLVQCKAGDLIVWDSRCIHCNTPALIDKPDYETFSKTQLLRIVAYICMSPLSLFEPDGVRYESLEEFRELREDFVRDRVTCTHWPLELATASRAPHIDKIPLKLNACQHSLIVGTHVEPENGTAETIF
ncbi:unnamed protein product [Adineta steineri]|uniref:Phytanoyl-CoA dioxygenase n=1 Tax=Adineta steineri TaxID=433720 RepID=A0A815R618_9BILA|nr:unnamed protein product [Adineta steineri]